MMFECPHNFAIRSDMIDVTGHDDDEPQAYAVPGYFLNDQRVSRHEYREAQISHLSSCQGNGDAAGLLRDLYQRENQIEELERKIQDLEGRIGGYEQGELGPDPTYEPPWYDDYDEDQDERLRLERRLKGME